MDVAWFPPTDGLVKINIHSFERPLPLPNENVNGLGIIIRDSAGKLLWGGMGHVPNNGLLLTQLKGMHVAAVKALQLGKHKTHFETDSQWVFESFRDQDEIIFDEETEKVLRQLNTLHANHFEVGLTDRKVACIIPEMNMAATYLADFGMYHLTTFHEFTEAFGNLQVILDEDMGLGVHLSISNIHPYLGSGEVLDAPSPPPLPVQISETSNHHEPQNVSHQVDNSGVFNIEIHLNVIPDFVQRFEEDTRQKLDPGFGEHFKNSKGKDKVLSGYTFNKEGLLSQEAIHILDSGFLSIIAKGFNKELIDLEEKVCEGIYLKDVLESAVGGSIEHMIKKIAEINISSKGIIIEKAQHEGVNREQEVLMDVEQTLLEMFDFDFSLHVPIQELN